MIQLSVIVPIYNAEKYLPKCIDSILQQSFVNFEILLINDGSSDNSGLICDTLAKKDKRISVFHKTNGGVSSARNLGINKAQGEWICFIDSDDWIEPGYFDVLNDKDCSDYNLIQLGVKVLNISDNSIIIRSRKNQKISRSDFFEKEHFCSYSVCYFYRRQKINSLKLRFNPTIKFSEDREFIIKMALGIDCIKQTSTSLYIYRLNDSSATVKKRAFEYFFDDLKVLDEFISYKSKNINELSISESRFIAKLLINSYILVICKNYSKNITTKRISKPLKVRLNKLENLGIFEKKELILYRLFTIFPKSSVVAYKFKQLLKLIRKI
ncbi:glycosyltransferase family 2 protein [Sunxiuqinia rutila]|uniref:glycosyltransferase family 2 protein n=1 Tax=Sunxiuqinia rutila TaxID=1397841 RepID=UPI003D367F56